MKKQTNQIVNRVQFYQKISIFSLMVSNHANISSDMDCCNGFCSVQSLSNFQLTCSTPMGVTIWLSYPYHGLCTTVQQLLTLGAVHQMFYNVKQKSFPIFWYEKVVHAQIITIKVFIIYVHEATINILRSVSFAEDCFSVG